MVLFQKDVSDLTLTVDPCMPRKNVLILSSMHPTVTQLIMKRSLLRLSFYNSTKYGVDIVDQMTRLYAVGSL